ncbi:hypothetical protein AKJ51_04080 [candidate division MSBL1 archaeon SCGC-AAA382A20]|uniref:Uncharacterized protein n=1 Tax=candidate division MSBL1 archaeon SCGC-AAA382A20 TaxID=1698280 RepID=A0A133VIA3_9EURY|nr:hypothetical protein AKJ51_04080 [candidate division MSBL1 archaeon SCGC-AAA382A20]
MDFSAEALDASTGQKVVLNGTSWFLDLFIAVLFEPGVEKVGEPEYGFVGTFLLNEDSGGLLQKYRWKAHLFQPRVKSAGSPAEEVL